MKHTRKLLAAVLALAMSLTLVACGGGGGGQGGGQGGSGSGGGNSSSGTPIKDLITWETSNREMENFFILNTEKAEDLNVLCNLYSSLLEVDTKGHLIPAIATEWGSDDGGLTWTFKLRDDVVWVDMNGNEKAKCTAQDWITALEWILNFQKNGGNNISMPCNLIAGAQEYYDYTVSLSEAEGKALDTTKFLEMVGIEAPDDYTLIYHCAKNAPYFDTLCVSACMYPISQAQIDEMGVDGMIGINNTNMWYNGAYTMTDFVSRNEKVLTANPAYWDTSASLFDTVTIRIIEDTTTDDTLFDTGEIDFTELNEANLRTIMQDENSEEAKYLVETRPRKYSYQIHLNYAKNKEDGTPDTNFNTAIANEAFRLSLYYGLDLQPFWAYSNPRTPTHLENLAYTMTGLLSFSDGTDYTQKVIDQLGIPENDGSSSRRFDPTKALDYKKQAMDELSAKGVTFPVEFDYYIVGGSQTALDSATILRQIFADTLGEDYVKLNIKTYVSSLSQEVVKPKLQSFVINGWGADYGDPENFVGQEMYNDDNAYYSKNYSNINDATDPDLIATYEEFTALAKKASQIYDDNDARYQAYVDAEVYMLQHALVIPARYDIVWQMTKINDYSKSYALYGCQNYLYKNWETRTETYTAEEYDQFIADFNS